MKLKPRIEQKRWDHTVEPQIFEEWQRKRIYKFNPKSRRRIFAMDTPPPYPSGRPWHIGAVAQYSQIDMIARTARMMNYEVLYPIGIDRNGLPVEQYTEREFNISMHTTSREKFIELCEHALDDLEAGMITLMKRLGKSGAFDRQYHTDSESYRAFTQATFIELWEKGLIYEATRPNNYCKDCGTTIADAEIEYQERPSRLVHVAFKVKETQEDLIIATTRPELICSCQLVIFNPNDQRYQRLNRLHAVLPIFQRQVEIRAHPSANPEFGTGAVMICSYGDYSDVLLFRELGLSEVIAIDEKGWMTEAAGKYRELSVEEAREKIEQDLEASGLLRKTETIGHRIPVCERSGTPIEIIPMREYYVKQLSFANRLKKLARKIAFYPAAHRSILMDWLNAVAIDWPISRRRFYATEIPIWYCKACATPHLPKPGRYYRPWRDPAPFKKCNACGSQEYVGETRTFDTWMDSSVSALYVSGYLRDMKLFRKAYPTAIRPQGKDIVRTWLHYSLLRCYQLTGKPPWKGAWIGGLGVDERGEKMSKSRGNQIDPLPLLEKYGGDAFRFWNSTEATLGSDFRCSETRIAGARNFITKLWNVARFISSFPIPNAARLTSADRWILSELSILIDECLKGYRQFNFFIPSVRIREFLWGTFASHYVELVKARAYGQGFSPAQQKAAWFTLHECLKTILLLLAPLVPFCTDYLWLKLYAKQSIHSNRFPKPRWGRKLSKLTKTVIEFDESVWRKKEEAGLTLRDPIEVEIPKALTPIATDLARMHNLSRI